MFIQTEPTGDDHILKFLPGRAVLDGAATEANVMTFRDDEAAQSSSWIPSRSP